MDNYRVKAKLHVEPKLNIDEQDEKVHYFVQIERRFLWRKYWEDMRIERTLTDAQEIIRQLETANP